MVRVISRVLLLDMDGVVLHQPYLHRFVAMRVTSFIHNRLKPILRDINYHQAEHMNRMLYSSYGHTLIGLNHIFKMNIEINEFNNVVYDDITMNYIQNFKEDPTILTRVNEVQKILDHCHQTNVPVYIFSNAPIRWNKTLVDLTNLPIYENHIIGSDHPLFHETGKLKPIPGIYKEVERLIRHRHGKTADILFVDDNMMNLYPCINMKRWRPILLSPNMSILDTENLSIRSNMLDILDLV